MHDTGKLITAEEAMCRVGQAAQELKDYVKNNKPTIDTSELEARIDAKQDKLTLPLPVTQGGTGATDAAGARANLGAASTADLAAKANATDLASKADASALNNKADKTQVTRDALISTIGVFGAPTATQAGTMGLVPAPPAGSAVSTLSSAGWQVATKQESGTKIWFGTCEDTVIANTKNITVDGDIPFEDGTILLVKFKNGTYGSFAYFVVNGNSVLLKWPGNPAGAGVVVPRCGKGAVYPFVYYDGQWSPMGDTEIATESGGK